MNINTNTIKSISIALFAMLLTSIFVNNSNEPKEEIINAPVIQMPVYRPVVTVYEIVPNVEDTYDYFIAQRKQNREILFDIEASTVVDSSFPRIANVREYTDEEETCLAKNIYFEARNQSLRGKAAVALVTLNRLQSPHFPNTVCDVVYERKQFSWYWDGLSDNPKNAEAYQDAENIAQAILSDQLDMIDFTDGSTHYHADPSLPSYAELGFKAPTWADEMNVVVQIDNHIFYRTLESAKL